MNKTSTALPRADVRPPPKRFPWRKVRTVAAVLLECLWVLWVALWTTAGVLFCGGVVLSTVEEAFSQSVGATLSAWMFCVGTPASWFFLHEHNRRKQ